MMNGPEWTGWTQWTERTERTAMAGHAADVRPKPRAASPKAQSPKPRDHFPAGDVLMTRPSLFLPTSFEADGVSQLEKKHSKIAMASTTRKK